MCTPKNGATTLNINNVGGEGADTLKQPDAIKVVHVGGKSDKNAFKLGGPVAIGVYEYLLHKGYKDDSWYLDSLIPMSIRRMKTRKIRTVT